MASKRTQIVEAIRTRFSSIVSGSNGYQTNLGNNVYVWRIAALKNDSIPAVNIRDVSETFVDYTQSANKMQSQHQMTVEIEILVGDGNDTISETRKCLEDVELAISTDETWGGLALRSFEVSNEIIGSQEAVTVAGLLLTLRIDFRTEKFKAN